MIRSVRVFFAVGVMALPLWLGTAARAQTCPALDVSCPVDQIVDTGGGAVDDVVGSVRDAGDDAADTAQDAVDTVQKAANDTLSRVNDTVDDTLGNGGNPPPGGGGGPVGYPGDGGGTNGPQRDPGANGRDHNGVGSGGRGGGRGGGSIGISSTANTTPTSGTEVPGSTLVNDPTDGRPSSTVARVATGVAAGVAVMALLIGAVALFLTVQDRLDRRDPKLMPASIGSDRVQFT